MASLLEDGRASRAPGASRAAGASRARRRHRTLGGLAVTVVALAACNSTTRLKLHEGGLAAGGAVSQSGQTSVGGSAPQAEAGNGSTGGNGPTSSVDGGGAGAVGTSGGPALSGATGGTGALPGPGTAPSTPGAARDAAPLHIGIHLSNQASAAAAFGVNIGQVNPPEATALVNWINAHGGMAGRSVVADIFVTDPYSGTFDSQAETACVHFAEDNHDFAVTSVALGYTTELPSCLAAHGTPLVTESDHIVSNSFADPILPYLYEPTYPTGDRLGYFVDVLAANHFFAPGAKIGLLYYDDPIPTFVARNVIVPALGRHGLTVKSAVALTGPKGASDASAGSAEANNAALQMRSAGVDTILFVPSDGGIPLLFLPQAASQGYRPTYGITSADAPDFLARNLPATTVGTVHGVGWVPNLDVPATRDPRPITGAYKTCHDVDLTVSSSYNRPVELLCDALLFLKTALDRAGTATVASLGHAVETMGPVDNPVGSFGIRMGPGRHDGTHLVSYLVYDSGRFRYVGPLVDVG